MYRAIEKGDPAPWFIQATTSKERYHIDTVAGRYIVLCFFGSAGERSLGRGMLEILRRDRDVFDEAKVAFFGVSVDRTDRERLKEDLPGIRYFLDFDGLVSKLYGSLPEEGSPNLTQFKRQWVIVSPNMRVRAVFPGTRDGGDIAQVADYLRALPPSDLHLGFPITPPVLLIPDVFDPAFCDQLIAHYEDQGGKETGFMREVDGKTVEIHDHQHKRRSDVFIDDQTLQKDLQRRIARRVLPEIKKVHEFTATRMERYLIGCYDSSTGGHFNPHRDNTTKGTAHRRFAISINLNDDFEGGEVSFPEYNARGFKMNKGGAVVFGCTLLHAVSAVRSGKRYAFLPFVYDDAAAAIRQQNIGSLAAGGNYKA